MEHVVSSSSSTPESLLSSLLLSSPLASFTGLKDDVGAAPSVDDRDPTISLSSSSSSPLLSSSPTDNSLFDEDSQRVVNIGDVPNVVIRRVFNTCAISFVGGDISQFAVPVVDEDVTTTAAADTVNAAAAAFISDGIIVNVGPVVWP
jgi:hypothetical protein